MKFDHRITLAVLLALAIEIAGALVWAGQVSERLAFAERVALQQSQVNERLARLEQQTADIQASLRHLEQSHERQGARR